MGEQRLGEGLVLKEDTASINTGNELDSDNESTAGNSENESTASDNESTSMEQEEETWCDFQALGPSFGDDFFEAQCTVESKFTATKEAKRSSENDLDQVLDDDDLFRVLTS